MRVNEELRDIILERDHEIMLLKSALADSLKYIRLHAYRPSPELRSVFRNGGKSLAYKRKKFV